MCALPYWRVVMARNRAHLTYIADANPEAIAEVLTAIREQGPMGNRDFTSATSLTALLALWQGQRPDVPFICGCLVN